MPTFASNMPTMDNVFKQHPRPEVRQNLLRDYRLKATEVLQQTMPDSIKRLELLIAEQANPNHPLWTGHVDQGQYVAENIKLTIPGKQSWEGQNGSIDDEADESLHVEESIGHDEDDEHGHAKDVQAATDKSVADWGKGETREDAQGLIKPGTSYPFVVPINHIGSQVTRIVRAEAESLYEQLAILRVWISLETPVIEDGNSFGHEVQDTISKLIDKYYSRSGGYISGLNRHSHDRTGIVRRWVQMPHMRSFAEELAASDRMDHHLARLYLENMLLICGSLLGEMENNWEKVINPKGRGGGGGEAMY